MKKFLLGTMLLALLTALPFLAMAQVSVNISIGLPPPIAFGGPPEVIVIPDTQYVYAVPDIDIELFFWNGWWWRPWQGRWYRSRYYDRGWVYYTNVPRFYYDVDPRWRHYYRERNWYGHPWYYERISQERLHKNWKNWSDNRHWERRQTWGVQNYKPRPPQQRQDVRRERQREYDQRPEVRQFREQRQQEQRRPRAQQPRQEPRENVQPAPRPQQPRVEQPPRPQQQRPDFQPQPKPQQQRDQGPRRSGPPDKPEGREPRK